MKSTTSRFRPVNVKRAWVIRLENLWGVNVVLIIIGVVEMRFHVLWMKGKCL